MEPRQEHLRDGERMELGNHRLCLFAELRPTLRRPQCDRPGRGRIRSSRRSIAFKSISCAHACDSCRRISRRRPTWRGSGRRSRWHLSARWGWQTAFGIAGIPGLVLALLYLTVRDYKTVELTNHGATGVSIGTVLKTRTVIAACAGGALQLFVLSRRSLLGYQVT